MTSLNMKNIYRINMKTLKQPCRSKNKTFIIQYNNVGTGLSTIIITGAFHLFIQSVVQRRNLPAMEFILIYSLGFQKRGLHISSVPGKINSWKNKPRHRAYSQCLLYFRFFMLSFPHMSSLGELIGDQMSFSHLEF